MFFAKKTLFGGLALGTALLAAALAPNAQAGLCGVSNQNNTFGAFINHTVFGPYTYVEAQFGEYGVPCTGSAWDVLYTNYSGALQFQGCGKSHYIGSLDSSHTVAEWTANCDPIYLTW